LSSKYTETIGTDGAISITSCNDNIKKRRKRVFHLFNCLLLGQVTNEEKTLKDERVIPLDRLGQILHVCPSSMACPYCYRRHRQQSQLSKTITVEAAMPAK
jgi:hypothetical protein